MVKITITEALVEAKLLDKRIEKLIPDSYSAGSVPFLLTLVGHGDTVVGYGTNEAFEKASKEKFQSIKDLITRRKKIKEAIAQSNAVTKVVVGGEELTVASALERKKSIGYEKKLMEAMVKTHERAKAAVETKNAVGEEAARAQLQIKDAAKIPSNLIETYEQLKKIKSYHILTGINFEQEIEKLNEAITKFEQNVDTQLSISNATTYIEI